MKEAQKTNGFNKAKTKAFVAEWMRIEADTSSKIGAIMAKAKDAKDTVLEAAEQIGITRSVLRDVIDEKKLRTKADKKRDEFAKRHSDNEDLIDQRDNVALAVGLALFDAADEAEAKKKPPAKKPAKVDPGKAGAQMAAIADAIEKETDKTQH